MHIDALAHMDRLREIAFSFPGITEASCYRTPAFYVNKKLVARLKEDGLSLVICTGGAGSIDRIRAGYLFCD